MIYGIQFQVSVANGLYNTECYLYTDRWLTTRERISYSEAEQFIEERSLSKSRLPGYWVSDQVINDFKA